jgi:hypothetical protein
LIKICKPIAGPNVLNAGAAHVETLRQARDADPEAGASLKRAFTFEKKIYGAAAVKTALRAAQHDKCSYCESIFSANSPGDVDHFRPKACVQDAPGQPMRYPGYFWLAYAWINLYYCCDICNRSGKRNLFPLAAGAERLEDSNESIETEGALLLDPGGQGDPRDHIRFSAAAPYGLSDAGRATIQILKLDRGDLRQARLRHLKVLQAYLDVLALAEANSAADGPEAQRARTELAHAITPEAAFTSMAIDFLAHAQN